MGLKDEFEQSLELQDKKLRALASTVKTLWNNQVKLQGSIDMLEEEFCVLGRVTIPAINELREKAGLGELTEETINQVFLTWHEFKKRSDFKEHFVPWFLGTALEDLPPPPEPEEAKEEDTDPAQEDEAGIEFGGDYEGQDSDLGDETDPEEQPEGDEEGTTDAVPEGQDPDSSVRGDEQEAGSEVSEVPNGV